MTSDPVFCTLLRAQWASMSLMEAMLFPKAPSQWECLQAWTSARSRCPAWEKVSCWGPGIAAGNAQAA